MRTGRREIATACGDSRFIEQVMEPAFDPVKSSTIIISLFSLGTDGAPGDELS